MAVDVVVVSYKTDGLLKDFCASYDEHAFEGCTLTVVDVQSESRPPIRADHVVHLTDNVGYGRACNIGATYGCRNDVLLLANADTLLTAQFAECYWALLSRNDWAVLGPRQVDEHNLLTAAGIFGHPRDPKHRAWHQVDQEEYTDVRDDAVTVSGALYFIKRHVWDELSSCPLYVEAQPQALGAFLETPHYYDETFCSYHARAHGYHCVYYGPAKMVHLWHRSSPAPGQPGSAEMHMATSQDMFRRTCRAHGIECD